MPPMKARLARADEVAMVLGEPVVRAVAQPQFAVVVVGLVTSLTQSPPQVSETIGLVI